MSQIAGGHTYALACFCSGLPSADFAYLRSSRGHAAARSCFWVGPPLADSRCLRLSGGHAAPCAGFCSGPPPADFVCIGSSGGPRCRARWLLQRAAPGQFQPILHLRSSGSRCRARWLLGRVAPGRFRNSNRRGTTLPRALAFVAGRPRSIPHLRSSGGHAAARACFWSGAPLADVSDRWGGTLLHALALEAGALHRFRISDRG